MSVCRDPSSSQDGLTSQIPSPKRTFSSRITLTMMLWLFLVLSKGFWSIMFWLIQAVQRILYFASVRHPESNGLVERANDIIMMGIMKLIFNQPRGKWSDELIKVVWSHNTTASRSTGFTPLELLFGDEAITPEEAKARSIRTVASAEDEADYSVEKDAIEGIRLQAVENINKYQAETIKWRDRKVRLKNIKPGHLVLRIVANPDTVGKLQLKWKDLFW
jgi:hypothetical protein